MFRECSGSVPGLQTPLRIKGAASCKRLEKAGILTRNSHTSVTSDWTYHFDILIYIFSPSTFFIHIAEDVLPKTKPERVEAMDTSPPQESIAILVRNESDINTIKEVLGDAVLPIINPALSRDPRSMNDLLVSQKTPVTSCFVIVDSTKIKEELLTKSSSTVYRELLKTANRIVGKIISSPLSLSFYHYTQRLKKRTGRSSIPL